MDKVRGTLDDDSSSKAQSQRYFYHSLYSISYTLMRNSKTINFFLKYSETTILEKQLKTMCVGVSRALVLMVALEPVAQLRECLLQIALAR